MATINKRGENSDRSVRIGNGNQLTNSPIVTGDHNRVDLNPRRRLGEDGKNRLAASLAKIAPTGIAHMISCVLGDVESTSLAEEIVDAFRMAKWDLPGSGYDQVSWAPIPKGLIVPIHSAADRDSPSLLALSKALYDVGFDRQTGEIDETIPQGMFRLIIGAQP